MMDGEPHDAARDPFALLGLAPSYALDAEDLRRALLKAGAHWHPDRYALSSAEDRATAETLMTAVNGAYARLADPLDRAEALLERAGVDVRDRETCPLFLMEVMELREAVDDGAHGALSVLAAREAQELAALAQVAAAWEAERMPAASAGSVATAWTEATYLHRVLAEARRVSSTTVER